MLPIRWPPRIRSPGWTENADWWQYQISVPSLSVSTV